MKKFLPLLFSATFFIISVKSQNTFPASGNAGIGTLSPTEKLTVVTATAITGITQTDGTIKVGTYVGGGAGYYGTVSNHPLYFRTNSGAAQVALLQNGNLGIGTTTPAERLAIRSASGVVGFSHTDGIVKLGSLLSGGAFFGTISNHPLYFRTNNSTAQITLLQNGRVGIGTTSPNGRLDVLGGDAYIQRVRIGVGKVNGNGLDSSNTAVGRRTLQNNNPRTISTRGGDLDVGVDNTAVGVSTLSNNTDGYGNAVVGAFALPVNNTGNLNTVVGAYAMYRNTYGGGNIAIGYNTLFDNIGGSSNCAVGSQSMQFNIYGPNNSALGNAALFANKNGGYNTACGSNSLFNNGNGNNNSALGYGADVNSPDWSNTTVIGNGALGTASNQVRIGNMAVMSIGGYANWTNISDGRVKKNIKENVPGLSFINLLKPVTYNLNLDEADKFINSLPVQDKTKNDEKSMQDAKAARRKKEEIIQTGFIAQDVEKAAKSLNYDFSGVDAAKNDNDLYGLRYSEFVVPLVKSVQELSKKNDELQTQVDELKALIADINKKLPANGNPSVQVTAVSSASLQQNLPNPFKNSTSISYTLPLKNVSAKIIITDKAGKTVKTVNVSGSGRGNVNINTSALSTGTYQYSLYVNEYLIETKQMILSW